MTRGVMRRRVSAGDIETRLAAAREVLDACDCLVAPSPSLALEFIRLGAAASRVEVSDYGTRALPPRSAVAGARGPGARTAGSRVARSHTAAPQATADGRLRIGYVGTIVWHKGVHVLVDALREVPPESCDVRIFGDPRVSPAYARDLEVRAQGLPVRFMGTFGRDQLADVYAGIDVLVVPSLWLENSPLVIHEAYLAGVPVVGSRIGGIADLVRDGWNGLLVDPGSPSGLAAALRQLVDRPGLAADFAARLPPVKTIADDARTWEERYARVIGARTLETAGAVRAEAAHVGRARLDGALTA